MAWRASPPRVEHTGEVDEHVRQDGDHGENRPGGGPETAFEEFRHGPDLPANVEGDEDDEHDRDGRKDPPFPVGHRHAVKVGEPDCSDELLGGDARGDHRETDRVPGEGAAGEEVVVSPMLLPAGDPEADHDDRDQVGDEDDVVGEAERHSSGVLSWTGVWPMIIVTPTCCKELSGRTPCLSGWF